MEPLLILIWIIVMLGMGSLACILGKKYGVELIIGTFAGLVVIANILASKIITFGPFVVPAAVLVYSTTFLLTDVLAEHWGKKTAQNAVWAGFIANVFLVVGVYIAIMWDAAPFWLNQEAFSLILGSTPRIVLASMVAYLVSQHHDVLSFLWWKKRTKGRMLWLRNNASTWVSQLIDTILFISIAFYGVVPDIGAMIVGQYVVKLIIAAVDTPFIYGVLNILKKKVSSIL